MSYGPLILIGVGILLSAGLVPLWSTLLSVAILVVIVVVLIAAESRGVRR